MTVLTTDNRREYTGDGTTTQFSFPIFFLEEQDVKVALRIDDVESKPVFGVDYTVTGAGNPVGGTVTFMVAPPAASIVVLFNDPPQTQTVDYQDNDEFPAETHERALDKLTILVQRLLANLDRTLRFSETEQDLISASEFLQRIEEAKTARDESVASATASSGFATKASEWADKDTEVEPGRNSSKTWADISEQWAQTVNGPALRADIDQNTADIATNTADIATNTAAIAAVLSPGFIFGLETNPSAGDPNNDIEVAPGRAAADNADAYMMVLAATMTKRLDAVWAVGTGNGGLDTGTKAANTTYHVWLIARSDTGVVDVLFSTSPAVPTMPANYDRKRRIWSVCTDGTGNIRPYAQDGDWGEFTDARAPGFSQTNPGTAAQTVPLAVGSCPDGIVCDVLLSVTITYPRSATISTIYALISSLQTLDEAPANGRSNVSLATGSGTAANTDGVSTELRVLTDTNRQIRTRLSGSDTGVVLYGGVLRWKDTRGKNS